MRARRTLTCVKMYELPGVILLNNSMSLKLRQVEVILQPDAVKIFQTQAVESDSERADISSVVFFFPREETTDSTVIRNAFIPAPTGKLNSLLQDGGEEVGLYLGQLHTPPPPDALARSCNANTITSWRSDTTSSISPCCRDNMSLEQTWTCFVVFLIVG